MVLTKQRGTIDSTIPFQVPFRDDEAIGFDRGATGTGEPAVISGLDFHTEPSTFDPAGESGKESPDGPGITASLVLVTHEIPEIRVGTAHRENPAVPGPSPDQGKVEFFLEIAELPGIDRAENETVFHRTHREGHGDGPVELPTP